MDAITKNWISEEQIQQMTDQALGASGCNTKH